MISHAEFPKYFICVIGLSLLSGILLLKDFLLPALSLALPFGLDFLLFSLLTLLPLFLPVIYVAAAVKAFRSLHYARLVIMMMMIISWIFYAAVFLVLL